MAVTHAGVA